MLMTFLFSFACYYRGNLSRRPDTLAVWSRAGVSTQHVPSVGERGQRPALPRRRARGLPQEVRPSFRAPIMTQAEMLFSVVDV